MRILPRYVVSGYLSAYAAILFVSLVVIAVIEMMVNLDHVLEFGDGLAGVAAYLFLRLPSYYLPFLLPIASFGAAFLCLGLPAHSLEILAARAGGISPRRLAAWVLLPAMLLTALSFFLSESLVVETSARFERNKIDVASQRTLFQSEGSFWYQRGRTLFRVESANREQRSLRGITYYERDREGRLQRSIRADRAWIDADHRWRLEDAIVRDFDPHQPEAAPRTQRVATTWLEVGSAEDLALLEADPSSLSLRQLGHYISARAREGRDTAPVRALWHSRAAEPFSVLLFALLAAPLGVAVERARSLTAPALQGVALIGAFYALQTVTGLIFSGLGSAAALGPWLLLACFGGIAARHWVRMGR